MGFLSSLQSAVADRLRASELFESTPAVEVLEEDKGDIDAQIARAVGRLGVVASIGTVSLKPVEDARHYVEATVLVEIMETVAVNRGPAGTGKTWLQLAEAVVANLMDWEPPGNWAAMEFAGLDQVASGTPVVAQLSFTTRAHCGPA